jgi:hypothetical protein
MMILKTMAIVVLAALAGGDARTPGRDEGIALCVQAKEVMVACKDDLADHFAAMAPPDRRQSVRAKARQEIIDEGTGPLEPRQAKCGVDFDRGRPLGRMTAADLEGIKGCAKQERDCKARVACWMALARPKKS